MTVTAMQVQTKSGLIRWDGRKVQCPSGVVVKTKTFASVQFVAKEIRAGYETFVPHLTELGLTVEDVEELAGSSDPATKQLMTRDRERVRCSRCGRVLWDGESIAAGMGPECRGRAR